MQELDAVNDCLRAITVDPVTTLGATPDATKAQAKVDEVAEKVLESGWSANTDYGQVLALDVNNKVAVPITALNVSLKRYNNAIRRASIRQDPADSVFRLYDVQNNTFVWDTSNITNFLEGTGIKADIIYDIPFADLPAPLQRYIAARAAREFQQESLGAATIDKFLMEREQEMYTALLAEEAEQEDWNVLEDSDFVNLITSRNNFYSGL